MNIFKQRGVYLCQQLAKSDSKNYRKKFLKFVLATVIAPVTVEMMPSLPPTTEFPPSATHQRPKIGFSIDSIVGDGEPVKSKNKKDENSETEDFNSKVLHRSHSTSLTENLKLHDSALLLSKELQKSFPVNKLDLLNQFRHAQHPLVNLHHLQQQIHFNQRTSSDNGNSSGPNAIPHAHEGHLRYNFQISPPSNKTLQSLPDNEGSVSAVNSRVTLSPADIRNTSSVSSRSPSPSDSRKSLLSRSPVPAPGCSSPDSRSGGSPANITRTGDPHLPNPMHLPAPIPVGPSQPIQQFGHFPQLGVPNFPVPGAHHPGLPPWGPSPNPHHPVAHPLYPWLLARHTRLFPPRFGPGAELPAFLFQPFRKPKRIRTAFSPSQLLRLEHAFEKNHYVVGTERKQLAKSLSLSETQVKVWFQNRRTKHKRSESEEIPGESGKGRSDLLSSNLSSTTSADSSTRHYSEEMSDDEELIMDDDEYSENEEEMAQVHPNFNNKQ